jgi:hypothetical protein
MPTNRAMVYASGRTATAWNFARIVRRLFLMITTENVTREDIVKALRENSIEQGFGVEFRLKHFPGWKMDKTIGYVIAISRPPEQLIMCAVGKIRYKLHITTKDINKAFFPYGKSITAIHIMNDDLHMTFDQIADEIERWKPL